jgi:hypothetical protein
LSPVEGSTFRESPVESLSVIPKVPSNTPESGEVSVNVTMMPEESVAEVTLTWTVLITLEFKFASGSFMVTFAPLMMDFQILQIEKTVPVLAHLSVGKCDSHFQSKAQWETRLV